MVWNSAIFYMNYVSQVLIVKKRRQQLKRCLLAFHRK
jgi:hypothetical protein